MAISIYFGLPGCGKTTLLVAQALAAVRSKRYSNVYVNVNIDVPGVTYITNDCIGQYLLHDGLLLIDEGTVFADSRAYKEFSKERTEFFLLHRHYNLDINLYVQQWDALDRKIRCIADRCYYIRKGAILGWFMTSYYRIPYDIIIPDPKRGGEKLGEIVQGYCKPDIFTRLFFTKRLYRPKYYKYFDSWEMPYRPALPDEFKVYTQMQLEEKLITIKQKKEQNKRVTLLRWKNRFFTLFRWLSEKQKGKYLSLNAVSDPSVPIAE